MTRKVKPKKVTIVKKPKGGSTGRRQQEKDGDKSTKLKKA